MTKGYEKSSIMIHWMHYIFQWHTFDNKKIFDRPLKRSCERLISDKVKKLNCKLIDLNFGNNKIYLIIKANPNQSPNFILNQIKAHTSKNLREEFSNLKKMPSLWTRECFISTLGQKSKRAITIYESQLKKKIKIKRKEQEHRRHLKKMEDFQRNQELKHALIS